MTNKKTNEANHNSYPVARLMSDFWKSRNHFLKRLESFNESELIQSSVHPRLNVKMRLVDMASFVAAHDDHHLVCMIEALVKAKK